MSHLDKLGKIRHYGKNMYCGIMAYIALATLYSTASLGALSRHLRPSFDKIMDKKLDKTMKKLLAIPIHVTRTTNCLAIRLNTPIVNKETTFRG